MHNQIDHFSPYGKAGNKEDERDVATRKIWTFSRERIAYDAHEGPARPATTIVHVPAVEIVIAIERYGYR
ncbi:hypothetical protein JCM14469_16800 [Desulfatiferula olefinivorans]